MRIHDLVEFVKSPSIFVQHLQDTYTMSDDDMTGKKIDGSDVEYRVSTKYTAQQVKEFSGVINSNYCPLHVLWLLCTCYFTGLCAAKASYQKYHLLLMK